ncbi:MAG TPA: LuxR C-terminal-related transcriptional regulator, partial [Acidimicrobiales bacterium]|nr:LuxR C-terminal-related transcriptional regulator [Acidimicrobiales bacterium]
RLLDALDETPLARITYLAAPAGYGKTCLVQRWLDRRSAPGDVLVRSDGSPEELVRAILRALAPKGLVDHIEHLVTDAAGLVDGTGRLHSGGRAAVASLVEARPDGCVVVDIAGDHPPLPVLADLAAIFVAAPGGQVRFMVAARARPHPALARLQAEGHLRVLDQSVLAMTRHETEQMLAADRDAPLPPEIVDRIVTAAEGWPAAVVIAARTATAEPGDQDDHHLGRVLDLTRRYLASEVLDGLTDDELRAAAAASIFDEVPSALVAEICGMPSASATLWGLRERSCFLRTTRRGTWLRFHPLMRRALAQHCRELDLTEHALRTAHQWFRDHRYMVEALRCLIRLCDWRAAVELSSVRMADLITADNLEEFVDLLEQIPSWAADETPQILGIAAMLELGLARPGRAAAFITQAERHPELVRFCLVLRGTASPYQSNMQPLLQAGEEAMARVHGSTDEDYHNYLHRPKTSHYLMVVQAGLLAAAAYSDEWDRVAMHQRPIDPIAAAEVPPYARLVIAHRHMTYHALAGHTAELLALADQVRRLRDDHPDVYPLNPGLMEITTAEVLRLQGREDEAASVLDGIDPQRPLYPWLNHAGWLIGLRAHLAVDGHRPRQAHELIEREQEVLGAKPAPAIEAMIAAAAARAHLALAQPGAALAVLAAAPPTGWTRWVAALTTLTQADLPGALAIVDGWPPERAPISETRRQLAIAATAHATGDATRRDAALCSASRLADAYGFVQPVVELGPRWAGLWRHGPETGAATLRALDKLSNDATTDDGVLTPSEMAVMAHLCEDVALSQIASALHLSINTVKSHVKSIYRKLGVNSRAEAIDRWRSGPGKRSEHTHRARPS